jgi:hypothetical protein
MPNTFTFNEDLSCLVVSEDDLRQIRLPSYNPSTQVQWDTEQQVKDWVSNNANIPWTLISELPTEEEQDALVATSKRNTRNQLLSDSDWTQITDSALTDEANALWVTYRSALRDLTAHENWPNLEADDWPTKP